MDYYRECWLQYMPDQGHHGLSARIGTDVEKTCTIPPWKHVPGPVQTDLTIVTAGTF